MSRPSNRDMCDELMDECVQIADADSDFVARLWDAANFDDLNGYDEQRLTAIYHDAFGG